MLYLAGGQHVPCALGGLHGAGVGWLHRHAQQARGASCLQLLPLHADERSQPCAQLTQPRPGMRQRCRREGLKLTNKMDGNQVTSQLERRSNWKACLLGEVPRGIWDEGGPAVEVGAAYEGEIWTI